MKGKKLLLVGATVAFCVALLIAIQNSGRQGGEVIWGRQFGSVRDDWPKDVITDSQGNICLVGVTEGNLFGNNLGQKDIFVIKYDSEGDVLWSKQFGTKERDYPHDIAVDSKDNIYIVGETAGSFFSYNAGRRDAFIVKLTTNGSVIWGRQLGSEGDDLAQGIAVDNQDNVYVVGLTDENLFGHHGLTDAFIVKYDPNGSILWREQFGDKYDDVARAVATDTQGNVYVVGETANLFGESIGEEGSRDALVAKFSSNGNLIWGKQFGTEKGDRAYSVQVSGNGVYIVGEANIGETLDEIDGFVAKYDTEGKKLWFKLLRTEKSDTAWDVALNEQGMVYVVGSTDGNLFGQNPGYVNIFVVKYDANGNVVWSRQIGTGSGDEANGVTLNGQEYFYIVGSTHGKLFGTNVGEADAFIAKLRQ